jgi:7 transmembrane receptor (rhodopsin family)
MYASCENLTETARALSICDPTRQNETEPDQAPFDEDLERMVSLIVFVLFGFIFVAGLIGNALVVIGELTSCYLLMWKIKSSLQCKLFLFINPQLVVAFNPLMRSTTNILIINLAISDLMFVIMCIPFTGEAQNSQNLFYLIAFGVQLALSVDPNISPLTRLN